MTHSDTHLIRANGIELCYESFGRPGDPAVVLIMGLGMQLIAWPDAFCEALAAQGFRVIRFDNRDVGHSSKIRWARSPNMVMSMIAAWFGLPVAAPYRLKDMAEDTAGLLDALGIGAAHIVGASMGGMIAQTLAARHPKRVLSLTSIMSSTGNRRVTLGKPAALRALLRRPNNPDDPESLVEHLIYLFGVIGSPGFKTDQEELRQRIRLGISRSHHPAGQYQQLLAILASGDRRREVRTIAAPTLVIHGADDPLVPVAAGRDTARCIRGAQLLVVKGMGHDLAPGVQAILLDAVGAHCKRAGPPG